MKILRFCVISIATAGLTASAVFADEAANGKTLFSNPKLGGGISGMSCNSCHEGGSGLEKTAEKKDFPVKGKTPARIEDAVNVCIRQRLEGKALEPESPEMAGLVTYIRTFQGNVPVAAPKKRTAATGC